MHKTILKYLLLGLFLLSMNRASANLLLNINTSNLSNVSVTATTGTSLATDSKGTLFGFTIANLWARNTSNLDEQVLVGSTLSPSVAGGVATRSFLSSGLQSGLNGLNLYRSDGGPTYTWTSGLQAFTGNVTGIDLSGADGKIQSSGNVYSGEKAGVILGTWATVPEPSTYAVVLGLLVGVLAIRKRFL